MSTPEKKSLLSKEEKSQLGLAVVASLTLGLAPFFPEPHLFGKWRWLLGGAEGMQAMDWFDLVLHSTPWAFLVFVLVKMMVVRSKTKEV